MIVFITSVHFQCPEIWTPVRFNLSSTKSFSSCVSKCDQMSVIFVSVKVDMAGHLFHLFLDRWISPAKSRWMEGESERDQRVQTSNAHSLGSRGTVTNIYQILLINLDLMLLFSNMRRKFLFLRGYIFFTTGHLITYVSAACRYFLVRLKK